MRFKTGRACPLVRFCTGVSFRFACHHLRQPKHAIMKYILLPAVADCYYYELWIRIPPPYILVLVLAKRAQYGSCFSVRRSFSFQTFRALLFEWSRRRYHRPSLTALRAHLGRQEMR